MKIERDADGGFVFAEVEPPLVELFLAIPPAADPGGSRAAQDRLFPDPAAHKEEALSAEWNELVRPELREAFENATATVEGDLEPLAAGRDELTIPLEHMDAWLNTLNQARLALAARYGVGEADLNRAAAYPPRDERDLAVSQIHVYGLLQECLIQGLEAEE
ncbi:MAG: DUF2017 family protein [Verrucomicrobiota bacterium]